MRILVVNAGSSSLKLRVLDDGSDPARRAGPVGSGDGGSSSGGSGDVGRGDPAVVGREDLGAPGTLAPGELAAAVRGLGPVDAVGHRIVHGGTDLVEPTVVDARVRERLAALVDLAPLHQPPALAALDEVARARPGVPAVACFDTAFHATLPAEAATYAVPAEWRRDLGLRRYGFHGLSHAHAARRAVALTGAEVDRTAGTPRIVTCHLGSGASLAAVAGDRSVDTTMGFTPLEGLVMATRSGDVDPGGLLWLQTHAGLAAAEVAEALEHRSGLVGLAGTPDMAAVVTRAAARERDAALALGVAVHRLRAGIATMAAALGGLDVLVFTGGVGENAPAVRTAAAEGLGFLGVAVDPERDDRAEGDCEVTAPGAPVRTLVVTAREDLEIARGVRTALASRSGKNAGP